MDRIRRIIELENLSSSRNLATSGEKWEASRLIWEEVTAGKTKTELGREINKTAMHVLFMYRCWDIVVVQSGLSYGDYGSLPSFYAIYNSPEVRGNPPDSSSQGRSRGNREPEDVHSRVSRLGYLASAIAADISSLDERERRSIRHSIRSLERALSGLKAA
jgi:hypothetical protein